MSTVTTWKTLTEAQREALSAVALDCMRIETLDERGSDRLDFHDVGVCNLRHALALAFALGVKAGKRKT